jgi:hypothetical protein
MFTIGLRSSSRRFISKCRCLSSSGGGDLSHDNGYGHFVKEMRWQADPSQQRLFGVLQKLSRSLSKYEPPEIIKARMPRVYQLIAVKKHDGEADKKEESVVKVFESKEAAVTEMSIALAGGSKASKNGDDVSYEVREAFKDDLPSFKIPRGLYIHGRSQ